MYREKLYKTTEEHGDDSGHSPLEGAETQGALKESVAEEYAKFERWGEHILGVYGWRVEITDDPKIPTAAADFENKMLYFSLNIEKYIKDESPIKSERKRLFIYSHELMHFAQALEDPSRYLQTFKTSKEKGAEYAQRYSVNRSAIRKSFDTFFNIFLDINDNAKVIIRNTPLQGGAGSESIHELYRNLFSTDDLSALPLNEQFMYKCIMEIMEPGRSVAVSDEVGEFFNAPFRYLGREYATFVDFIRTNIFGARASFTDVIRKINSTAMPIFEDFLKKDLENGTYEEPRETPDFGEGAGGANQDAEENPMKDFAKRAQEAEDEESKPTGRKVDEELDRQKAEELKRAGFSSKDAERIMEVEKNGREIWEEMMALWNNFFSKDVDFLKEYGGRYRSGRFSNRKFNAEIPVVLTDPSEAQFSERKRVTEEKESWRPQKISFVFCIDQSMSMSDDQRKAMQVALYAIYNSYLQFQRDQYITHGNINAKGTARFIGYGDQAVDLMPLTNEEIEKREVDPLSDNLTNRIRKALIGVGQNLGSTNNAAALVIAMKEADKARSSLEKDEEIMIIIETTDGDPNEDVIKLSNGYVKNLNSRKNVYSVGLRFGGSSSVFRDMYGENGEPVPDPRELMKIMMKVLSDALTDALRKKNQHARL